MKFVLLIFPLLMVLGESAYCQKVEIAVFFTHINNDQNPDAIFKLYALPDTILLVNRVSGTQNILFSVNSFSGYLLRVSAIGYENIERILVVKDKPIKVSLEFKKKITSLSGVVVVSKKPFIQQDDEKTIIDAEVLATSSSNAYEILEKTPGAVIDQDGNVYLNSLTPATIQINGREIKLNVADIASLLKSLPSGSVSKIEILRNPSAKYDAASSGGIVNIVLKKGAKAGTSGSINTGYFQGVYSTRSAGFNLNFGKASSTSYMSYQATHRNNFEDIQSTRLLASDHAVLSQKSGTTYPVTNHYISAGTDISVSKKWSIAADIRLVATDNRSHARSIIDISNDSAYNLTGNNESLIDNKGIAVFLDNNVSSKYKIDSAGSNWTIEMGYNYFNNNNQQGYNNI